MNTEDPQARYYAGVKMIRYDLIKESAWPEYSPRPTTRP